MEVNFPVVVKHKDMVLKLHNWMHYPAGESIRNVEAFDLNGNKLWVIEAQGGYKESDFYTGLSLRDGRIHAFNFQCYDCVIDEATGKVISSHFTK